MQSFLRLLLPTFFILAGLNHFRDPAFYYPLIPDYLPWKISINILSGLLEVILGALLFFKPFQRAATWGLIALLVVFVPSHIHFIVIGSCIDQGLCVPSWVAWLRLLVVHPLLIWWVFQYAKSS
ncbi:MAG: hypothetical protein AAGF77_07425 [Bacteroidota bacterium]